MPDTLEKIEADFEAKFAGRDIQQERSHLWMTTAQLQRAALRLCMKTRIGGADHKTGKSDPGTDAALVADAYLKITGEDRTAMDLIHRAAERLKNEPQRPRVDLTKLKMHPSIQLASGRYFDFIEPHTTPLEIEDIATGLSRICRYTGQLAIDEDDIYSVGQHSVLASENCDPDCDPFEALMHDRAESVLNDMASPLKQLLLDYKEIEDRVEQASADYYGVPHPMSDPCKRIDLRMLATEKRDLMPNNVGDEKWALIAHITPLPFTIRPWRPSETRHRFLQRYYWLTEGRVPKPTDRYAVPHENAPSDYVAAVAEAWGYDVPILGQGQHYSAYRNAPLGDLNCKHPDYQTEGKIGSFPVERLTLEQAAKNLGGLFGELQAKMVDELLHGSDLLDPYAFDGLQTLIPSGGVIHRDTPAPKIMEIGQEKLKAQVRPVEETLSAIDVIDSEIKKVAG